MSAEPTHASRLRMVKSERSVPQQDAEGTGLLMECVAETVCPHCKAAVPLADAKPLTCLPCPACGGEVLVPGRVGGFLLLQRIGEGEMGAIYRATDESLHRDVAIKVVRGCHADDPASIERLRQEACAAGRLNHPRVAQVHALGFSNGHPYLVMELVTGEDFAQKLHREGHIDERTALRMALDVADGLSALAREGLAHGDIKPGNIVLDRDGNAKLVDFGLSGMTRRFGGVLVGTPHYIAPELLRGGTDSNRSDIYSLGATLYHLLAGRTPFEGETPADVVNARLYQQPTPIGTYARHVSLPTRQLVMRMLQPNPDKRHADSEALAADIREALAQLDLPLPTDADAPGSPRRRYARFGLPVRSRTLAPFARRHRVATVILGMVSAVEFMIAARIQTVEQPAAWLRREFGGQVKAIVASVGGRGSVAVAAVAPDFTTDANPVWRSVDLGTGTQRGSTLQMGDTMMIQGAGADMWTGNDRCRFVWTEASDDYALSARVKSIAQSDPFAITGLLIKGEDPARGAGLLFGFLGSGELFLQTRQPGRKPAVVKRSGQPVQLPCHLRVVRHGKTFEASISIDGTTWSRFATCEQKLPARNTIGLSVSAQTPTTLATAEFAGLRLLTPALAMAAK
jgi:hypothetical protein